MYIILYDSNTLSSSLLSNRIGIGIWVCFYMIVGAVADWNKIIVLCTRFTDEIFSFLVSSIYKQTDEVITCYCTDFISLFFFPTFLLYVYVLWNRFR